MFYRKILKKAFFIVWENKFLLIPGFLVSLFGNGGEYNILLKNFNLIIKGSSTLFDLRIEQVKEYILNFKDFIFQKPILFIFLLLLLIAIAIFLLYLIIVSQISLISCSEKINRGEKTNLKDGFKIGNRFFLSVLLINILAKLLIFSFLILIFTPFFLLFLRTREEKFFDFLVLFSFILLIPLAIIISFISRYIFCYLIIKKEKLLFSLKQGINLFFKNWLISLEMALILFLINLFLGLGLILLIFIFFLPFILLSLIFHYLVSSSFSLLFLILGIICLTIVILLFTSFFSSFQYSSWVLLFLEIESDLKKAKILRLFKK